MNNLSADIPRSYLSWQEVFDNKSGPQYVEFGKKFHNYGATDWQILDYSDIEFRKYGEVLFREEFAFQNYLLNNDISRKISIVFTKSYILHGFIFVQFQQKREGKYSDNPRTNRPFIQARFLYLTTEIIIEIYKRRLALFTSLLVDAQYPESNSNVAFPAEVQHIWTLRDYKESNNNNLITGNSINLPILQLFQINIKLVKGLISALLNFSSVDEDNTFPIRLPQPILVVVPNLSLYERLQVIDAVQYYVYPVLGIISFSLDAVVDRDVVLRFYDASTEKDALTLEKLDNIVIENNFSDYYDVASQLDSNVLYHEGFRQYLLSGKTTQQSSRRLFLDLKEFSSYLVEDWIGDICEFLAEIETNKLERNILYDRLDRTSLQIILSHKKSPPELLMSLLNYLREKNTGDLLEYMVFYFSVPADRLAYPPLKNQIRTYLMSVIEKCDSKSLLKILNQDKVRYYSVLLLYVHDAKFLSKVDFEETVLKSLMYLPGDELIDSIKFVFDVAPNKPFLDDFVFQLNSSIFYWSARQILDLWNSLNLKSPSLYSGLLNQLLGSGKNVDLIISNPNLLKDFLYLGREMYRFYLDLPEILLESRNGRKTNMLADKFPEQEMHDIQVLPELEVNLSDLLRKVVLRISETRAIENIKFIEWWIFAELGYMDIEIIKDDLYYMQKSLFIAEADLENVLTTEFKYILSFGQSDPKLSLQEICRNCDGNVETLLDSINQKLLRALAEIWIESGVLLNVLDIQLFIEQLPSSAKLLVKITQSELQNKAIISLETPTVLRWLEMTEGDMRFDYIKDGKDTLCMLFMDISSPDSNLAWRMLVVEDYSLLISTNWSEYVLICAAWKKRLVKKKKPLSEDLEMFFDIIRKIAVNLDDKFAKRKIINLLVNRIVSGNLPEITDFTESVIVGLCAYSHVEALVKFTQTIKLYATEFVVYFLNDANSLEKIRQMTQTTQAAVVIFIEKEKSAILNYLSYINTFQPNLEELGFHEQEQSTGIEAQEVAENNDLENDATGIFSGIDTPLGIEIGWTEGASTNNQINPRKRGYIIVKPDREDENDKHLINTEPIPENPYRLWIGRLLYIVVPIGLFSLIVIFAILLSIFNVFDIFSWLYTHFNWSL